MPRTDTVGIADQLTGGKVSARMRELREAGATHEAITTDIAEHFGLTIDRVSVTRWFQRDTQAPS